MQRQGIMVSDLTVSKAVTAVAREHQFHPVREYLDGLVWDGTKRLDGWLSLYCGAEPSDYAEAVGVKWMISAIARVRIPGVKVDHALILESVQGEGKSTAFSILGEPWFTDDVAQLGTKDAALGTSGVWIVELAELDAMNRAEVSKIKSFISRQVDRVRPVYGRHFAKIPRQCVFCGTSNLNKYLKDDTGGRRFWPVKCGRLLLEALRRDRDQLWAEARVRYEQEERWWLDQPQLIQAAKDEQEERYERDPWEGLIDVFLHGDPELVTTTRILSEVINKERGHWTRTDEIRVGIILNRLGWESGPRKRDGGTRQRTYCRKVEMARAAQ